ncbi:40S ribosomal protein S19-1 [Phytophthora nicotianae]|uniref:40S ribosomal protein S19-1 n=1 Tax=Phytophthora nicotianae TaxID=4792 RepID=A0A0W8DSK2_PHYNI|nr:40S ribosomal protein S19-1 [Phytophthora nicotianae]
MSDLRENLYAFRKQMREIFIRVEDMVDVHRSFFKSDPSTGKPVFHFDKRMEQIRCSLNAIANGRTPINHQGNTSSVATPPKNFTVGGAGLPIRAMMDVTRTRPTPLEAPGISRRLGEDDSRPRPGGREAELRHLLRELNHINSSNEDEED